MSGTAKKKHRSSWLITVPLAAGVLAYLVWVFLPGMQSLRELRAEIQQQRDYIAQADKLAVAIQAIEADLQETEAFCVTERARISGGNSAVGVQSQVMKLAQKAGLAKANLSPLPVVRFESFSQQPISVSACGSYEKLIQFLAMVESLPEAIWVSELRIEGGQKDGRGPVSDIKLEVFTGRSEISN